MDTDTAFSSLRSDGKSEIIDLGYWVAAQATLLYQADIVRQTGTPTDQQFICSDYHDFDLSEPGVEPPQIVVTFVVNAPTPKATHIVDQLVADIVHTKLILPKRRPGSNSVLLEMTLSLDEWPKIRIQVIQAFISKCRDEGVPMDVEYRAIFEPLLQRYYPGTTFEAFVSVAEIGDFADDTAMLEYWLSENMAKTPTLPSGLIHP